ncbi:rhomboid-like protein [Nocardia stercoris]|uniref:Rhomboid family intramembrane serine protease n=1 Tax=Nocardia stercoris TaxID=2483361 RepID=A0A3M2L7K7_9NOCA|nr:rhomboid-like protein [Nocardia stercoris]RMI32543.1 hypothetical protein EBN03_11160 [Nocardia stercoris]
MVVLETPRADAGSGLVLASTPHTHRRLGRLLLPVTWGYAALLVAVTVAVASADEATRSKLVRHASTNLHNLLHGRLGTLFSSAFVIGDSVTALVVIPLLVCLLALAERRFGSARLVHIFLSGHVGSTLLVAAGLLFAVRHGWVSAAVMRVDDVGISYGAMALIGAFVAVVPARLRVAWIVSWPAVAVAGMVLGGTFTNVGHFVSVCIGLLAGAWLWRTGRITAMRGGRITALRWSARIDLVLLASAAVLGYTMLIG